MSIGIALAADGHSAGRISLLFIQVRNTQSMALVCGIDIGLV